MKQKFLPRIGLCTLLSQFCFTLLPSFILYYSILKIFGEILTAYDFVLQKRKAEAGIQETEK